MHVAGLKIEGGWVREGGLTVDGAILATRELLAGDPRPTAIFCANDEMAMGCIHEIKSRGLRVPGDISVVGFDDTRYARILDPPLTTVHQPAEDIGVRVMKRLLAEIENGTGRDSKPEIVPHRLVIRRSTAPPRVRRA
jgi:LacI family repressor for deo operon, udp, cdd, tsx, nupC, and nupG